MQRWNLNQSRENWHKKFQSHTSAIKDPLFARQAPLGLSLAQRGRLKKHREWDGLKKVAMYWLSKLRVMLCLIQIIAIPVKSIQATKIDIVVISHKINKSQLLMLLPDLCGPDISSNLPVNCSCMWGEDSASMSVTPHSLSLSDLCHSYSGRLPGHFLLPVHPSSPLTAWLTHWAERYIERSCPLSHAPRGINLWLTRVSKLLLSLVKLHVSLVKKSYSLLDFSASLISVNTTKPF